MLDDLPEAYDEPFADSSQLPTLFLARSARGAITAALSGDGGDETFGSYERYRAVPAL
jgi:asparagine synthase (glutamine-hydrolysing)